MLLKKVAASILVLFFIISISTPAFAATGAMIYEKSYNVDGKMIIKIQSGDKETSPAQHKTLIEGKGHLVREETVLMSPGLLSVNVDSDWQVAETDLRGLSVASVIELNDYMVEAHGSNQVFAVKVESERGEQGSLTLDFSAAQDSVYGQGALSPYSIAPQEIVYQGEFEIDQRASTTGGKMKRYIELVCPVSGTYLFEDSEIRGSADVSDSLRMDNTGSSGGALEAEEQSIPSGDETNSDGQKEQLTADSLTVNPARCTETGEHLYILESECFESEVLLNTPFEDIGLPEMVNLSTDIFEIQDVFIEWNPESLPLYNPGEKGPYVFLGELLLPESIFSQERMVLLYTVEVVSAFGEGD